MRIELPGRFEENVVPIGFLREQGLQAEVVDTADADGIPAQTPAARTQTPLTKEVAK